MRFFLMLPFFCFSLSSLAQSEIEKKYIMVDGPAISGASQKVEDQLRKTVMSVLLRDKQYNILLNKNLNLKKTKLHVFKTRVFGSYSQTENEKSIYSLTMIFTNERKSKLVRKITETGILERHLLYRARLMTLELLYGNEYLAKLDKKTKDKERKRRQERKKNKINNQENKESEERSEAESKKKDKKKIAEKKNVEKKKEEEKDKKKDKDKKSKSEVTISNFSSPDLDLRKNPAKGSPSKGSFKAYYDFSYGVGYSKETLNSKTTVKILNQATSFEVENNLALLQVYIRGNARLGANDSFGLSASVKLSKIMGDTDYEVSAPLSGDAFLFKKFSIIPLGFITGLKYESSSFANLGESGQGITPWKNKVLWLNYGAYATFSLGEQWFKLGAEIGSVFSGSTNYRAKINKSPLEGSRSDIYIQSRLTRGLTLELKKTVISMESLESKSLLNKQDQFTLTLLYN